MLNAHATRSPGGDSRLRSTPVTKTGWVAGALAALYAIGVVQYLSPIKFIGLGAPTMIGFLAGACGLFAVLIGHDRSWLAWLGVLAGVVAAALVLVFV